MIGAAIDNSVALLRILNPTRGPIRGSIDIGARAETVRALVHDPVQMAQLGEEIHEVHYLDGATVPDVGVRFHGSNRNGIRRWTTTCTITDYSDTRFGFVVATGDHRIGFQISRWQYDLETLDTDTTRLTQTNWIKVPLFAIPLAIAVTGIARREQANAEHIARTLERVRAAIEG
jgi:hypothetical protein